MSEQIPSGDEIRAARGRIKRSQVAMAKLIGVTYATYSRWENGWYKPSAPHREKLNKMIEISNREQFKTEPQSEVSDE